MQEEIKSKVQDIGGENDYKVVFYPLDTALKKFNQAYDLYDVEKVIAVGQEREYRFASLVKGRCGFNNDNFSSILLEESDFDNSRKVLDKIIKEL